MKKILFMISTMNIGGVEKSLLSLLSVIPKEKYDITILVLEKKGEFLDYIPNWVKVEEAAWFQKIKPIILQPPKQTIKDYYIKKSFTKLSSFLCSYFISKKLNNRYFYYRHIFKNVSDNNTLYDVAIAFQGPTDIIDYYIANKVKAKKKISWIHFDVSKHFINEKLYNRLYKSFNKIFVVSKEARKRLIEKIPTVQGKTEVFLNIVPKELINNLSKEKIEFDDEYKGKKIVTVGRLSREKGQDFAIKALYKLLKDGYDIRWYCFGEGNCRKEYESLIEKYDLKENFILMGARTNPYPYIAKADIYVQTSRHEGYCLTLAEARCLAKPIITTNFIGAYEQIEDGNTGYIVNCDEEELYLKIKYLLDNETVQNRIHKNLSNNNFDTEEEIKKLIDYIS
ncbi:glycosyltransferase [Mesobacillus foraminis]|uniref:glycosyltransferase n=1 Tax=Mesobacillus foraminis TaxID=279826 RepID=UPI0039A34E2E